MKPAPLKPRPNASELKSTAETFVALTRQDWEAKYFELERLYVHERHRLRYVIQYMEKHYAFKASEQAYKKRFARWGFCKNVKRSRSARQSQSPSTSPEESGDGEVKSCCRKSRQCPVQPLQMTLQDELVFELLVNIRSWSKSFFESRKESPASGTTGDLRLPWDEPPNAEKAKAISASFKLVVDLLDRDHGELAGRVARKAFLLVEEMIDLSPPALLWNYLEMMYIIIDKGHWRLFQLLLNHLWNLVSYEKPPTHPAYVLLRGLRRLVKAPPKTTTNMDHSQRSEVLDRPQFEMSQIALTLERAWTVNAEMVFQTLGVHFMDVYCCMSWDTCAIRPPPNISSAARPWIENREKDKAPDTLWRGLEIGARLESNQPGSVRMNEVKLGNSSFIDRRLFKKTLSSMRYRGAMILEKDNGEHQILLRILAGLVTADVIEPYFDELDSMAMAEGALGEFSCLSASMNACTIRLMMDLEEYGNGEGGLQRAAEQLRQLVWMRSCAHGSSHPKVIQEMLLLEDALIASAEAEEARVVRQQTIGRIEAFVADIPASSA